jgi:hypothetical protein
MEKVYPRFKDWCISKFGENDGSKVYHLYYRVLKLPNNRDKKYKNSVDNIEFLLDKVPQRTFLAAVDFVQHQHDSASLEDNFRKLTSFTKFVMSYIDDYQKYMNKKDNDKIKQQVKVPEIITTRWVVPTMYKKISTKHDNNPDISDKIFDWSFKCECGEVYTLFNIECPQCKNRIDVTGAILLDGYEKITGVNE